jgi:hypothetical protein
MTLPVLALLCHSSINYAPENNMLKSHNKVHNVIGKSTTLY